MAQILRTFDEPIQHSQGAFRARVVGRLAEDRMWEGWLEFIPLTGQKAPVVSPVESRQPALEHLEYWAQGLTVVYAEGSLDRALRPVTVRERVVETPFSSRPARRRVVRDAYPSGPEPVLDPFDVGRRNPDILRQELHALNRPRLINIITAYGLNPAGIRLDTLSDEQLISLIVSTVEAERLDRAR
jgi:hypothetical protein